MTRRTSFQISGAQDKIADLKAFVFYSVHTSSFLVKQVGYWCAILWNLEVNILGFHWFKNIKTKVWNTLTVEKLSDFDFWNILVTDSNLSLLNINLRASLF